MSLRLRLTLIYVALTAPVLAILSVGVLLAAQDRIYSSVDRSLAASEETVESALFPLFTPVTPADIQDARGTLDRLAVSGDSFRIYSVAGQLLYSSTNGVVPVAHPPASAPTLPNEGYTTESARGERTRVLTSTLVRNGTNVAVIQTQTSLAQADSSISEMRRLLVLGSLAAIVAVALPAYLLAGRALKPVRDATRVATDIEATGDFSERVPAVDGPQEVRELSRAFNRMIDRVQAMMLAQKAFLAESSHELRRPLTILRTNIDVMNDPRLSDEDRQNIEEEMRAEAQAMSRLISDLMLLSRDQGQDLSHSTVNLSAICQQALDDTSRMFDRSHRSTSAIEPEVYVEGDPERLRQAIENLLENAYAYTPPGGDIRLELRRDGDEASLTVSDTGIGIGEDDQPHIFERFYRGSQAGNAKSDGFGLGLAIVRHVVEAHSGSVRVESSPGAGSAFTLRLPLSKDF